jgi:type IV secretory pathway TraG/TraD family ATPase VirD4
VRLPEEARRDLGVAAVVGLGAAAYGLWRVWRSGSWPHWAVVAVAVAAGVAVVAAWAVVEARGGPAAGRSGHGMTRAEVSREVGTLAVRERGKWVRPSARRVEEMGLLIGRDVETRAQVWASLEDSVLVVGPPRSGKTRWLRHVIEHYPGPAIVTSTRAELAVATAGRRTERGPCWVFSPLDPGDVPATGLAPLRWSPADGCAEPRVAAERAASLLEGGSGFRGATDRGFWEGQARLVLRCYLMAAAVGKRPVTDLLRWAASPSHLAPIELLRHSPVPGWADELAGTANAGRTTDSIWTGVRGALSCLADPAVAAACSPPPDQGWRPADLLDLAGTLYLWGPASAQASVAGLVSALVDAVVHEAQARAATARSRLDPPLLVALDEAANIAPLPGLPHLLSDGGGSGITSVVVLQSLSQARHRWGEAQSEAMWGAATAKLILPGLDHPTDLEAISRLSGEVEVTATSRSTGPGGTGVTTATAWRPRWTPEAIRGLRHGHALALMRRAKPLEVELTQD